MMLIPMFLGYVLFGYGLKTVPASKAITLTLFEPLVYPLFCNSVGGRTTCTNQFGLGWF